MKIRLHLAPTPVPGPPPLPVLGSVPNILRFFADPVAGVLHLYQRYGDLAAASDRDASVLCAFGASYNRQILTNPALFTNNDEALFPLPDGGPARRLLKGLTLTNGADHRRNRRLMMPAFHKSHVERYRDDIADLCDQARARWLPGRTLDMADEMVDLTLRIAHRCLFGLDLEGSAEGLGHLAMQFLEGLTSVGALLFPYDVRGTPYRAFLRTCDRLDAEIRALIHDKRAQPEGARDVLSLLLRARDEEGSVLSEDELIGEANNLFLAGHETTAVTLLWTLFLLEQHPRVAEDLRDELSGALRGGAPSIEQLSALPLLDAVVKESMRLLPAAPVLFMRRAEERCELGRTPIPKGARIYLSPLVTHRDPDVFPHPARFRPERWRGLSPSPYEYLPFGAGPRMCIGAGFASMATRIVLAMVAVRLRFEVAPGARISRKFRGITLGPKHGMPMILAPATSGRRGAARRVRGDIYELIEVGK